MVLVALSSPSGLTHIKPIGLYITINPSTIDTGDIKQIFVRFQLGYKDGETFVPVYDNMQVKLDESHVDAMSSDLNNMATQLLNYMIAQGAIQGTIE